jgi:hypothetical protein
MACQASRFIGEMGSEDLRFSGGKNETPPDKATNAERFSALKAMLGKAKVSMKPGQAAPHAGTADVLPRKASHSRPGLCQSVAVSGTGGWTSQNFGSEQLYLARLTRCSTAALISSVGQSRHRPPWPASHSCRSITLVDQRGRAGGNPRRPGRLVAGFRRAGCTTRVAGHADRVIDRGSVTRLAVGLGRRCLGQFQCGDRLYAPCRPHRRLPVLTLLPLPIMRKRPDDDDQDDCDDDGDDQRSTVKSFVVEPCQILRWSAR